MKRAWALSSFLVLAVTLAVLLVSADVGACLSMGIIIAGLVFLVMQTGSAACAAGPKSPANTALISTKIVEMDSNTRWRPKPYEEYELAFTLLSVGLVLFAITALMSILFL